MASRSESQALARFTRKPFHIICILVVLWAAASAQLDNGTASVLPSRTSPHNVSSRPLIKADVDLVLVEVTVLDHSERAVNGLEASDFVVTEDNNPQTIRYLLSGHPKPANEGHLKTGQ